MGLGFKIYFLFYFRLVLDVVAKRAQRVPVDSCIINI